MRPGDINIICTRFRSRWKCIDVRPFVSLVWQTSSNGWVIAQLCAQPLRASYRVLFSSHQVLLAIADDRRCSSAKRLTSRSRAMTLTCWDVGLSMIVRRPANSLWSSKSKERPNIRMILINVLSRSVLFLCILLSLIIILIYYVNLL